MWLRYLTCHQSDCTFKDKKYMRKHKLHIHISENVGKKSLQYIEELALKIARLELKLHEDHLTLRQY